MTFQIRERKRGKMATLNPMYKRLIHLADKFVRRKQYSCLFPGCNRKAISSHSIPRASCIEALSVGGHLYSRRLSFNEMINATSPSDPPDIVETGARNAGTFKGYCPQHDALLFFSAETDEAGRKNGMLISLHLRALSLEFCRKRQTRDFLRKFSELVDDAKFCALLQDVIAQLDAACTVMKDLYLGNLFSLIGGSKIDSVQSYSLVFGCNLQVSCCGCFNEDPKSLDSAIAFNLISYSDLSFLALTVFKVVEKYLQSFLSRYSIPDEAERLVNDIAFLKCEEPLISSQLWRSLPDALKKEVRLCLRHPVFRTETLSPRVINIKENDVGVKLTPELMARLGYRGVSL